MTLAMRIVDQHAIATDARRWISVTSRTRAPTRWQLQPTYTARLTDSVRTTPAARLTDRSRTLMLASAFQIAGEVHHCCSWSGAHNSWFADCFFFQAEDGIRDRDVTGVQTCALPI